MKSYANSPIQIELQALYQGLYLAHEMKLQPLEVETDAIQVIIYINNDCITYDYH